MARRAKQGGTMNQKSPGNRLPHARRRWLLIVLIIVAVACLVFKNRIQQQIQVLLIEHSTVPSEALFQEAVNSYEVPVPFLERIWESETISHRRIIAQYLKRISSRAPPWYKEVHPLLLQASHDVDVSVRELALSALSTVNHPELFRVAREQLADPDPMVRLMGVQRLRQLDDLHLIPVMMETIEDPNLRVATTAAAVLRTKTGNDFGVRISQSLGKLEAGVYTDPGKEKRAKIEQGLEKWGTWWESHRDQYPDDLGPVDSEATLSQSLPMQPFALPSLNGEVKRWKDYQGKTVLLNFWTTWCPSCLEEIPGLVELHAQATDRIEVVGISLDGQPDAHGHGHALKSIRAASDAAVDEDTLHAGEEPAHASNHSHRSHDSSEVARLENIRKTVSRFARKHGMNYEILLDPHSELAGLFSGHELPTNVLIDSNGNVRRRWIGGRSIDTMRDLILKLDGSDILPLDTEAGNHDQPQPE